MQTQGGEAAAAAVESSERHFVLRLTVDFDRTGNPVDISDRVDNIRTDRALKGSAPEEIMLVEGSSAAELRFDLTGDLYGLSPVSVFSPFNGDSPFYNDAPVGAEVVYELGIETVLGTVWYPQFVGNLRTINPSRRRNGNIVEFTALDRVEKLRRPVQFAPFAVADYHLSRGTVKSQLYNSQSIIDHCLRHSKVSPTRLVPPTRADMGLPPTGTRDGCLFWLTGTGSYNPTIGWRARAIYDNPPTIDGSGTEAYDQYGQMHPDLEGDDTAVRPLNLRSYRSYEPSGSGDQASRTAGYWTADRDNLGGINAHYLGVTLALNPNGTNIDYAYNTPRRYLVQIQTDNYYFLRIRVDNGQIYFTAQNGTGSFNESNRYNIPTDVENVEVRAYYNIRPAGEEDELYFRVGNVLQHVSVPDLGEGDRGFNPTKGLILVNHDVAFNDLWYTFRSTGGVYLLDDPSGPEWSGEARQAEYAASLDRGLQELTHLPVRKGEDAWEIIQEVVSAEYGAAFWDEKGIFRFWNANRIHNLQSSVVRDISLDQVSHLDITNSLDSVRNVWSLEASRSRAIYGSIYESRDPDEFRIPGQTLREFRIWSDNVIAPDPFRVYRRSTSSDSFPDWDDDDPHCYVVQWLKNGSWVQDDNLSSGVDINVSYDDTGDLILRVWNGYSEDARFARGSQNLPSLKLGGVVAEEFPRMIHSAEDQDSVAKYGPRNMKIDGPWAQERLVSSEVDAFITGRTVEPIPTTDAITIPGDPRLQLGDTVDIKDPDGMGETLRVQILGIQRTFSKGVGLEDVLTVELVRPSGVGIWDSEQYGRWDETFIWS